MPTDKKFLDFIQDPQSPVKKTKTWTVYNSSNQVLLGYVYWYAPWRGYTFQPTVMSTMIFDHKCLSEISTFIKDQTKEHKGQKKAEKEAKKND